MMGYSASCRANTEIYIYILAPWLLIKDFY